jgi:hypothetical protein
VIQLLTERVARARDLPGMLAWRLGRALTAARRDLAGLVRQVPADEDGVRYAAMLAARAGGTLGPAAWAAITATRAELEAIQRRCRCLRALRLRSDGPPAGHLILDRVDREPAALAAGYVHSPAFPRCEVSHNDYGGVVIMHLTCEMRNRRVTAFTAPRRAAMVSKSFRNSACLSGRRVRQPYR